MPLRELARRTLRGIALLAAAGLAAVVYDITAALRAGSWRPADLAALEVTVVLALAIGSAALFERGRRVFELDVWPRAHDPGDRLRRLALLWSSSLAAILGVMPGLGLGLGPAAAWPVVVIAVASAGGKPVLGQSLRRVLWLHCACYGVAAVMTLLVVCHVF